jgi:hypothetical protein
MISDSPPHHLQTKAVSITAVMPGLKYIYTAKAIIK